jgi:hypothetical protein
MALFTSKVDALKVISPESTWFVADQTSLTAAEVGNGNYLLDPTTGKSYTVTAGNYVETTETLPAGTNNQTLRYDGGTNNWVATSNFTVTSAGVVTAASTIQGTALTATTGAITATAGGVQAGGGTLTAGTTGTTAGTVVVYATAGATGVELSSTGTDTLKVGNGSNDGIIDNLADPTTANQASNKQYVDAEDGFLRTFTGKTAAGSENPTYSNTNYVTQSVSLEAAIGELDGDVFSAISALSSGVSWKGVAVANVSALTIRDDIGGTHTLATTNDLTTALGSLSSARPWFSTSDDAVLKGTFTAPNGGDISSGRRIIQNVSSLSLVEIGNTLNDVGGTLIASGATVVNKGAATHVLLFSSESGAWFGKTSVTATGLTADIVGVSHSNGFMYLANVVDTGYTPSSTITSNGPGAVTATGGNLNTVTMNVIEVSTAHTGTSSGSTTIESLDMTQVSVDFNMASHTVPVNAIQIASNHYVVYSTNGLFKVIANVFTAQSTPALADTYGVLKDLIQTPDIQEYGAIYTMGATAWIKIGEFAIGQIQDGSTANTLPTWSSADSTWKQFSELLLTDETSPINFKQLEATTSHALVMKSTSGVALTDGALGTDSSITVGGGSPAQVNITNTVAAKKMSVISSGAASGVGIEIIQQTTAGDINISNNATGSKIVLSADADKVVLGTSPTTDQQFGATAVKAVTDVNFIRTNVVLRKIGSGTTGQLLILQTAARTAEFHVEITDATAGKYYSSRVNVTAITASTVDTSGEYAIVGTLPNDGGTINVIAAASSSTVSLAVTVSGTMTNTVTAKIVAIPVA